MKKILLSLLLAPMVHLLFAQTDNQNPQNQNGTPQTPAQQTNPNQYPGNSNQTSPNATNQNMQEDNSWDLYDGTRVETTKVPQSTTVAFTTKYPNRNDV